MGRSLHLLVVGLLALLLVGACANSLDLAEAQACPDAVTSVVKFSSLSLSEGLAIVVPAGETYLYDLTDSPVLGGISIFGKVVFKDGADRILRTRHITALSGGWIIAGSKECPYTSKLEIILSYASKTDSPHGTGTKVIGVTDGGNLQLVGRVNGPAWTQLSKSTAIGDTQITLKESVSWKVGDEIVIASTDFDYRQTEERKITAVDGNVVTVDSALKYIHYGEIYKGVDMRAEVGHLTRSIVVRGDDSSDTDKFGGHIMMLKAASIHIQGVEVTKSGQYKNLGRYPVHFHLGEDLAGRAFFLDNSIHHNYQRCLTIHGTNGVQIWRNVGYYTNGHCFFMEDGVEMNNYFAYNLAINPFRIPSADFLPGTKFDNNPACFWITNPNNTYVHNHAVGGDFGFWLAFSVWPTGMFEGQRDLIIRRIPLQLFAHNTAHTTNQDGMFFDRGMLTVDSGQPTGATGLDSTSIAYSGGSASIGQNYDAWADPFVAGITDSTRRAANQRVTVNMYSFTAYKCKNRGSWFRVKQVVHYHAKFADNAIGWTSATSGGPVGCVDCIFIGQSPNIGGLGTLSYPKSDKSFPIRGFEFYDGPTFMRNNRYFDYVPDATRQAGGIGVLRDDRFGLHPGHTAIDNLFANANQIIFDTNTNDGDRGIHVHDVDGSISGRPTPADAPEVHGVLINDLPYLLVPGCDVKPEWSGYICPNIYGRFKISLTGTISYPSAAELDTLEAANQGLLSLTRSDKPAAVQWYCGGSPAECGALSPQSSFRGLLPFGYESFAQFKLTAPATLRIDIDDVEIDDWAILAFCYPTSVTVTAIDYGAGSKGVYAPAASWSEMANAAYRKDGSGLWFHDKASGWVYMKIFGYATTGRGSWLIYTSGGTGERGTCTVPSRTGFKRVIESDLETEAAFAPPRSLPPTAPVPPPPSLSPEYPKQAWDGSGVLPAPAPSPTVTPPPPTPTPTGTPVDCVVSAWGAYEPCSTSCGTGVRTRFRTITTVPENGGQPCGALYEETPCTSTSCPTASWNIPLAPPPSVNTVATGSVVLSYNALTLQLNYTVTHDVSSSTSAHLHGPVSPDVVTSPDASAPPYFSLSPCCTSPISGSQTLKAAEASDFCSKKTYVNLHSSSYASGELRANIDVSCPAPVGCVVSAWSTPSPCSASCGSGVTTRTRTVTTQPEFGGASCDNLYEETACTGLPTCSTPPPTSTPASPTPVSSVECSVGPWTPWGPCSAPCGGGNQTRTRSAFVEPTGGNTCPHLSEEQPCNPDECESTPPAVEAAPGTIGCFNDNAETPDLSAYSFSTINMSRYVCELECIKVGSTFYGLQESSCFCGDADYGAFGQVDLALCDTPCPGNPGDVCGSVGRNSIYNFRVSDGFDPAIDGGGALTPPPSPGTSTSPSPPSTRTPSVPIPVENSPAASSQDSESDAVWTNESGFKGVGLVWSIVIIVVIVLVVVIAVVVVAVVIVKRRSSSAWDKYQMDMY